MFGFKKKEPVFIENDLGKFKLVETKSVIYADGRKQPHIHRYYGGYAVWHGALCQKREYCSQSESYQYNQGKRTK